MFFIIRFKISLKVLTCIAAIMKNTVTRGKVPLPLKYVASLSLQVIYFWGFNSLQPGVGYLYPLKTRFSDVFRGYS